MNQSGFRHRLAGMAGNILEHYDNALFGLLAPFISPLFFNSQDPLMALILMYGMLPLGILMRPLGALFFGWIGDRWGRTRALFCSLLGMAMATFAMGCLPTYRKVGAYAALFLCLGRIAQNFCAAGEISGGAIFVLEHTEVNKKDMMSSIYSASTIVGILLASLLVTLFSWGGKIEESWRILFWLGGITALLAIFFRLRASEGKEFLASQRRGQGNLMASIKEHRRVLFAIICVSGFGYVTYSLPFVFMNGYIPLITPFSKTQVMGVNTLLLVVDMFLLPLFGYLATKSSRERVMFFAAVTSVVVALPLFYCLKGANLAIVIGARTVIVVLGVAFSATYHAWAQDRVPVAVRYTLLSLGYAIGSQLIGASSAAICLWLYKTTEWHVAPAFYLMVTAGLGAIAIKRSTQSFTKDLFQN